MIINTTINLLYIAWSLDLSLLHQWQTFPLNGVSFPQLLHLIIFECLIVKNVIFSAVISEELTANVLALQRVWD
jgi:hypothetical protein